jgi:hypothetical protein
VAHYLDGEAYGVEEVEYEDEEAETAVTAVERWVEDAVSGRSLQDARAAEEGAPRHQGNDGVVGVARGQLGWSELKMNCGCWRRKTMTLRLIQSALIRISCAWRTRRERGGAAVGLRT